MPNDDVNRIILNFGAVGDTYYIDNIKFGEKKAETKAVTKAATRAGGISYKLKTAEEKRELLLGAMESWIKGMYEHLNGRVLNYDVINEPIADNNEWRGVDGNFMGDDTTPEESTESGLNLNWDSDHFYWGYYIGKDYGVKAFEYARKYAPEGSKLFVNEYGLESSPNKLAALLGFIDYIDQNGQTVDGIGTQMHVSTSITRAEVDAMFKTLAATGKYVRVTELDVQMGTTTPSTEELAAQAETYQMIIESYKENVPEAQQSGITIWSLTDNAREHEYWLPDDQPNIFDANYGRKHAYKGVCDGLAGYDISTDFDGTMWQ
jgi:GH35 family endo-1,4-beta-xylanase